MSKKLLWVQDFHSGSEFGLMPPEVNGEETESVSYKYGKISEAIYEKYEQMVDNVGKVDAVVTGGDMCEGPNWRGKGHGNWTNDINLQVDTAVNLLKMIKGNPKYYGVQGSFYHTSENISSDRLVTKRLGGQFDHELKLKVDKVNFHFSHKIGVSSSTWQYRTTPIAREMLLATVNEPEFGKFDVICRGHAHYFCYVGFGSHLGIIGPCWKGRDPYVKQLSLAYNPHLGYVLFEIDGEDYEWYPETFKLSGNKLIKEVRV